MRNIDFWFESASCAFRLLNRTVTTVLVHLITPFKDTGNYIYRVISQTLCVLHAKSVVMFHVSLRQQTAIVCTTLGDVATCRLFAVHLFVLHQSTSPALAWPGLACEIQACGGPSGTVTISLPALLFCLLVCILILLLAEGQAGEGWERSDKAMLL